jgi:hypothetical protein
MVVGIVVCGAVSDPGLPSLVSEPELVLIELVWSVAGAAGTTAAGTALAALAAPGFWPNVAASIAAAFAVPAAGVPASAEAALAVPVGSVMPAAAVAGALSGDGATGGAGAGSVVTAGAIAAGRAGTSAGVVGTADGAVLGAGDVAGSVAAAGVALPAWATVVRTAGAVSVPATLPAVPGSPFGVPADGVAPVETSVAVLVPAAGATGVATMPASSAANASATPVGAASCPGCCVSEDEAGFAPCTGVLVSMGVVSMGVHPLSSCRVVMPQAILRPPANCPA